MQQEMTLRWASGGHNEGECGAARKRSIDIRLRRAQKNVRFVPVNLHILLRAESIEDRAGGISMRSMRSSSLMRLCTCFALVA